MDRTAAEARLDRLVRENRFTVAVVFPLAGAALLVGSAEGMVPPPLAFAPALVLFGTLVMRLPLLAGLAPLVDRRAGLALGALVAFAFGVEFAGLTTGLPYGEFHYGRALGPTVGGVPLGLPLFFCPLAVNALLLAVLVFPSLARRRASRVALAVGVLLAADLALDPAAVALGFWNYPGGGPYYGVPLSNYAGWLLSGTVAVALVDAGFSRAALLDRLEAAPYLLDDLVSFTLLWGVVNAVYANWLAVAVTAALVAGLVRTGRFDVAVDRGGTVRGVRNR